MILTLFQLIRPILPLFFLLHDRVSDWMIRNVRRIKIILLIGAHATLAGFLFPEMRKDFGEMAANLLILILFLSPLSKIFRMRLLLILMGLRRELGIFMAYLATVHGVGYFLDPAWFDLVVRPYWPDSLFSLDPMILFGIVGYFLTLPLLLTSNTLANRVLGGKGWKRLHRVVYGVFLFVVFHRFLMRGGDPSSFVQAGLLLGSYGFLKLLAWRNILPPLRESINLVSSYYEEWKALSRLTAQQL